jgi:tRNA (guanine37-N1)-methyltransferase
VLTGGDNGKVKAWRKAEAERLTQGRRADLWTAYQDRLKNPAKPGKT